MKEKSKRVNLRDVILKDLKSVRLLIKLERKREEQEREGGNEKSSQVNNSDLE